MAGIGKDGSTPQERAEARRKDQIVEFYKMQVIGTYIESDSGEVDIMTEFFRTVERDARDDMNEHTASASTYEMTDALGCTTIEVTHLPSRLANGKPERRKSKTR